MQSDCVTGTIYTDSEESGYFLMDFADFSQMIIKVNRFQVSKWDLSAYSFWFNGTVFDVLCKCDPMNSGIRMCVSVWHIRITDLLEMRMNRAEWC